MHTLNQIILFKATGENEDKKVTLSVYLHKLNSYPSTVKASNQQIYDREKLLDLKVIRFFTTNRQGGRLVKAMDC